jgi:hypothetical protein
MTRTLLVCASVAGVAWTSGCGGQSQQPVPGTEAGTAMPVCRLAPEQCQDDSSCALASTPCDGGVVGTWNAMGYDALECIDKVETGGCTCRGTFRQQGGLGVISANPLQAGRYAAAGALLTTTDSGLETTYEYCVKGENLALTLPDPGTIGLVRGPDRSPEAVAVSGSRPNMVRSRWAKCAKEARGREGRC